MIKKIQLENIKSVTPPPEVALQFQDHADLYLKRTVWATGAVAGGRAAPRMEGLCSIRGPEISSES
jgi:hypothetical protein